MTIVNRTIKARAEIMRAERTSFKMKKETNTKLRSPIRVSLINGNKIRICREDKGLNQTELSRVIGVNRATVNLWENGKRNPEIYYVKKLAEYFGVDINYLLGFTEKKHNEPEGTEIKLSVDGKISSQSIVLPSELVEKNVNYFAKMNSGSKTVTIFNQESYNPYIVITVVR